MKIVLKNVLDTDGIPSLRVKSRARVVWHHSVSTSIDVLHRTPNMIFGSGLNVPNISSISAEFTGGKSVSHSCLVADGPSSGVDEPCALFEMREKL